MTYYVLTPFSLVPAYHLQYHIAYEATTQILNIVKTLNLQIFLFC